MSLKAIIENEIVKRQQFDYLLL